MRAMILRHPQKIETSPLQMTEMENPKPSPGEIRIRVEFCGICRTDLHVIEGELPPRKTPVIPGHQIVGTVEKLGAGVRRFKGGERVGIAWLRETCGACEFCLSGRENLCARSGYTGYGADGGYASLAIVREDFAYEIPDSMGSVEAVPLLCAGIIGFRALERSELPRGGTLALYGFGSSAHIVIQLARHRSSRVFVVTRGHEHRALAREMGAAWVGERAEAMPEPADSAIIFAPAGELVPGALAALKKGGTLATAGIYMSSIPALDYEKHLFYEKNIRSVTANTREDGRRLLEEAARIPIKPKFKLYDLEDANKALQDLKNDEIRGTGILKIKE